MFRGITFPLALILVVLSGLQATAVTAQDGSDRPGLGGEASISGTITFTDGKPVVARPVEWRPAGDPNGGSTVQTDAEGRYTITGLKDGEYFVGYFHPDRLPAERNRDVVSAPDAASDELEEIGRPLVRRVMITDGKSISGIDFVITNIGDESVEGPESGNSGDPSNFPATGNDSGVVAGQSGSRDWLMPLLLVSVGLLALGVCIMSWPAVTRFRR